MPLSRFLVEAAREGCDLATAEGRAHMASNARPLWTQLPDGALKRQLLSEIAAMVQLAASELTELWAEAAPYSPRGRGEAPPAGDGTPGPPRGSSYGNAREYGKRGSASRDYGHAGAPARPRAGGRTPPNSRADHAGRLLLGNQALWDALSNEDHGLLCELPSPHGALFVWLESQLHEHGVQPWAALREGLREHEAESLAHRIMAEAVAPPRDETDADAAAAAATEAREAMAELRDLLDRMLVERLKAQETEAIAAAATDPAALQRYRELQARRRELEANLTA
jgi:DNA primase